jgi:hypothetical protein
LTNQSISVVKSGSAIVGAYVTFTATVTTGDQLKIKELSQVRGVVGMKLSNWTAVEFTYTGNILTVTTSNLLSEPIIVTAGGLA